MKKILKLFLFSLIGTYVIVIIIIPIGQFLQSIYEAWESTRFSDLYIEHFNIDDNKNYYSINLATDKADSTKLKFFHIFKEPLSDYEIKSNPKVRINKLKHPEGMGNAGQHTAFGLNFTKKKYNATSKYPLPNNEYNYFETVYDKNERILVKKALINIDANILRMFFREKKYFYDLDGLKQYSKEKIKILKSD